MTDDNRWLRSRTTSGDVYDATYDRRAAAGESVHGEADFIEALSPRSVLDAGCGTGRVGRELARRGMDVVGVDIDDEMLATARRKSPDMLWLAGDISTIDLGRAFDTIVMAGNVMIFLAPGSEGATVANLARHLGPRGSLVAGFQLQPGRLTLKTYDEQCEAADLALVDRFATWDREPFERGGNYAVSVHRR